MNVVLSIASPTQRPNEKDARGSEGECAVQGALPKGAVYGVQFDLGDPREDTGRRGAEV